MFEVEGGIISIRRARSDAPYLVSTQPIFEMFQDFELGGFEGFLEAVGEADEVVFPGYGRGAGDDADGAAGVDKGVAGSSYFHKRNDLGPGKDVIGRVRHRLHRRYATTPVGLGGKNKSHHPG